MIFVFLFNQRTFSEIFPFRTGFYVSFPSSNYQQQSTDEKLITVWHVDFAKFLNFNFNGL